MKNINTSKNETTKFSYTDIIKNLNQMSRLKLIIFGLVLIVLLDYTISSIIVWNVNDNVFKVEFLEDYNTFLKLFITLILAPFVETVVAQYIIIELFFLNSKITNLKITMAIITSAIVFSLGHVYNWYYVLNTFITGLIFGILYIIGRTRKDISGFILVFIIHSSKNLLAFFYNEIL